MKVMQTEKVFLATDEINIINQFDILIADIKRMAESEDLRKVCDDVLTGVQKLVSYTFHGYEEDV